MQQIDREFFFKSKEYDVIKEVAKEQGLSVEEVAESWESFKREYGIEIRFDEGFTKPKRNKRREKAKRKLVKKSRRKNREK